MSYETTLYVKWAVYDALRHTYPLLSEYVIQKYLDDLRLEHKIARTLPVHRNIAIFPPGTADYIIHRLSDGLAVFPTWPPDAHD